MPRFESTKLCRVLLVVGLSFPGILFGCGHDDTSSSTKKRAVKPLAEDVPNEPPPQAEPDIEESEAPQTDSATSESEPPAEGNSPLELSVSNVVLSVPNAWRKVKPDNNIVEAEFALPHAAGDEFDGRLTLMAANGNIEAIIGRRTSEFISEQGVEPVRKKLTVGDREATQIDVSGVWYGPDFKPIKPPRNNYRMLFVIVPFGSDSAFYAKLTGPAATIAQYEAAFDEFLKSAKFAH